MKIISNNQTVHSAGLTYVQFENQNESTTVGELFTDLSIVDTILMDDGFFCKTTELDDILEQLNEYLNEEEED